MLGAQVVAEGVAFCVWAPLAREIDVITDTTAPFPLHKNDQGFFVGVAAEMKVGQTYRYRLNRDQVLPDPCSRFQPEGPHGPSAVVDPNAFRWADETWRGLQMPGQVLYEMHVGAFTAAGTFDAAITQFKELKRLGITAIEVMPLNECAGQWNWGYDGVNLFAPSHHYGDVNGFKRFVNAAHQQGLGVLLDVVYNHLGPDNYLHDFSPFYFTDQYKTDWGAPLNFAGEQSEPVRDFVLQNVRYWIKEFHVDGLRIDATQNIYDESTPHILAELTQCARKAAAPRDVLIIGENEPEDVRCLKPVADDGYGFDALWNDDFHHSARVAVTGFREAYYSDYLGCAREFIAMAQRGFLYQGQHYTWQRKNRGTRVTSEPAYAFIHYTQNHDQIANTVPPVRITRLARAAQYRALTAFQFLMPETPMLFMGQEFGSTRPFHFFADHPQPLAATVWKGRRDFLAQFRTYARAENQQRIPNPANARVFHASKLDFSERKKHATSYRFHRELIRLRRVDPVVAAQDRTRIEGVALNDQAFVLRYFGTGTDDRLMIVNLGPAFSLERWSDPLFALAPGQTWKLMWSSEEKRFGGRGTTTVFKHLASPQIPGPVTQWYRTYAH